MKEGWEYKKLGEVCNIVGGGTPDTKKKEYWGGNIPWATVSDMNCNVLKSTGYNITDRGLNESSSRIINKGEIIIATRVGLGKVCKLAIDTAINQDLKGIIPKENNILRDFIFYYFKHKSKHIVDNGIGATVKGVKIKFIEGLSFGFPPLSEQQSIVDYLDSAFAKIDAMKANAEKALNEAKALFQASLKKMLEPKDGWEEKKLKEVVISITDGDHQPPPKSPDGIPFITISNIDKKSNKILFEDTFYVPQSYFSALKKDRIPNKGDVLYTVTGSFGIPVLVDFQKEFCFQRHIALIRPNMGLLSPPYLFYWILSSYAISQAEATATGAAQRTVSLNSIRNFTIHTPTLSEQQAIVTTLDSLKSKVDRLQENFDKISQECDALKQAILRQIFE